MTDEAIVHNLLSEGTSGTWEKFLSRFSNLILKIVWQFEKDYDEAMDKYLYVCGKLAGNNFAILRRFEEHHGDHPPQFTTWLASVAHNLCIDAHRAAHGRRQLPRAILRLSEFDREVFRLYYWRGYSREEIEQQTANTPKRTATAVTESLEKIQSAELTTYQPLKPTLIQFDEQNVNHGSNEAENDFTEMLKWMERWLDELGEQERMIVKLWFWEDMSGRDIATAMRISPEHRVYSLLKKTMARLRERASQTYADQRRGNLSV
ncbi:MAG TPA: sigma factor-like helix-turn-helix DNA-binding protein [Bacteroidota bacterium]|nr:sigma factor-like helix-turn-helix DNA-binding protein [Bacteroidota bacterium]